MPAVIRQVCPETQRLSEQATPGGGEWGGPAKRSLLDARCSTTREGGAQNHLGFPAAEGDDVSPDEHMALCERGGLLGPDLARWDGPGLLPGVQRCFPEGN